MVDRPTWLAHGRRWSHLASDTSYAELHAFAARLGLPPRSFDGDHYDLVEDRYADALAAGAVRVTSRAIVVALQTAGLRRRKRSRLAQRPG